MNTNKTISVEPGKITLAERKNRERAAEYFRTSILNSETQKIEKINLSKLLFPTQKSANLSFVKYSVPLRSIFSALLIISGILTLQTSNSSAIISIAILSFIFGGFLALGLLTRVIMGASAIMFGLLGIITLREGTPEIQSFLLMFGSLCFFLSGSGKYSIDTIIRKQLLKYSKKNSSKEASSYKVFHYVTKNL